MELSRDALLRGVAEFQLKDYEGAKRFFEQAVWQEPNGTFARLAGSRLHQFASLMENEKTVSQGRGCQGHGVNTAQPSRPLLAAANDRLSG